MTDEKQLELPETLQRKEMPKFDIAPFIGKTAKVEKVELREGKFGHYLFVQGEIVARYGDEKNPIEVRPSKMLGLQTDSDDKPYIGEGSKADVWLRSVGVEQPKQLIGKPLQMTATEPNKEGLKFLTF